MTESDGTQMKQKRKGIIYPVLSDGFRGVMAALTAVLSTTAAQPLIAVLLFFGPPPVLQELESSFLGAAVSLIVLGFPLGILYTGFRRRKKNAPLSGTLFTVGLCLVLTAAAFAAQMVPVGITLRDGLYLLVTFFVFASVWTGIFNSMLLNTSSASIGDTRTGTSCGNSPFLIKKRKD